MALRIDKTSILSHRLDHNGYLRVDAYATRAGVFVYQHADGSVTRELRHPDEVFKNDSIDTLASRPVVDGHPRTGMVTAKNTKHLIVGWSGERIDRAEEDHAKVSLLITDEAAISNVSDGKNVELSCGYQADIVAEDGEYNGEKYDHVQKNIVYNHIAFVERGRAGRKARVYLDSDESGISQDMDTEIERAKPESESVTMKTVKLKRDGVQTKNFKMDAQNIEIEESQEPVVASVLTHLDSAVETIRKLEKDFENLQGKYDGLKEKADQAISPERLDALARERADLCGVAAYLGMDKFDGMTNPDLKKAIVEKANPELKLDEKSADYVEGRYESVVDKIRQDNKGLESLATLKKITQPEPGEKDKTIEREDEGDAKSPRDKLNEDLSTMWQGGGQAA